MTVGSERHRGVARIDTSRSDGSDVS